MSSFSTNDSGILCNLCKKMMSIKGPLFELCSCKSVRLVRCKLFIEISDMKSDYSEKLYYDKI